MKKICLYIISIYFCLSCSSDDGDFWIDDNLHNIHSFNKINKDKITETVIFDYNDLPDKKRSRIPTVIIANNGNILAACEKRELPTDKGAIDIFIAISEDEGRTFKKFILFSNDRLTGRKMNPSFVIDRTGAHGTIGRIYCFVYAIKPENKLANQLVEGNASTLYRYSDDNGLTWSNIVELKCTISNIIGFGPSPANGIQLKNGTLIIPGMIILADQSYRSGIIFKTPTRDWDYSYITHSQSTYDNECTIVEIEEGDKVLVNSRVENNSGLKHIYVSNTLTNSISSKNIVWDIHPTNKLLHFPSTCQGALEKIEVDISSIYLFTTPTGVDRSKIALLKSSNLYHWEPIYLFTRDKTAGYSVISYYNNQLVAIFESDSYINAYECMIQNLSPLLPFLKNNFLEP